VLARLGRGNQRKAFFLQKRTKKLLLMDGVNWFSLRANSSRFCFLVLRHKRFQANCDILDNLPFAHMPRSTLCVVDHTIQSGEHMI
jgi:hypothetical protein